MNIVIYPSPNKSLNPNEEMFAYYSPRDMIGFRYIEDVQIETLDKTVTILKEKINSITILLDNYGTFIKRNIDFILSNKQINFYILENDLHYLKSKQNAYKRYMLLRNNLINNNHIYILAFYWYHYKALYKINPNNLICFPKFVTNTDLEINENPIMKVVLSGSMSKRYPMRRYISLLNHPQVKLLTHEDNVRCNEYYKFLNKYICGFSCCSNETTPYIVSKFFEIPASGCLLLAYDEFVKEPLKEIGFVDGKNYISCNKNNIIGRINFICNKKNINIVNKIRINGYNFVKNNHAITNRFKLLSTLIEMNHRK